jgi:archaellum component FlaC
MIRQLFLALLTAAAMFASFPGSGIAAEKGPVTSEEVEKQAQHALDTAKEYTMQEKQEYQKKMESQLADLSKQIDQLKETAKTAKQDVAARLEGTIAKLKKQQEAAEKKLPELRSATSKAWGEVKSGVDKAVDDLKKAYDSAKSHFE